MNKFFSCANLTKAQIIEGATQLAEMTGSKVNEFLFEFSEDEFCNSDIILESCGSVDLYVGITSEDIELKVKIVPIYKEVTINSTGGELVHMGYTAELSE
jgi:hypothetical protein